jgi:tRNA-binding EMAP/Myf-like protein
MPKIASIEKLISVEPHPNADRLDLVKVLGYQCVTERGLHSPGDLIIYIQPDSVLPEDAEWAEGYRKYSPTRIKAVKLRGEFSEGVIFPMKDFLEVMNKIYTIEDFLEGTDVSALLGITHYEPPMPQDLSAKGLLPLGIPKTDETRCLSGDSILSTDIGFLTIREICEKELTPLVKSWDSELCKETYAAIINHAISSKTNKWLKITLECGRELILTNDHRVYLPSLNCFRDAGELQIDDYCQVS